MKKHIVCLGDSNTHGYCADPRDSADGGNRYNEEERWPCVLQTLLGEEYLVLEEGLSGRTTVFADPLHETMDALGGIFAILMSHEPVDLLVVMLGTNDSKERFVTNPTVITIGMERLLRKAMSVDCWGGGKPNILLVCPPPIGREIRDPAMGPGCAEISEGLAPLYEELADRLGIAFLDAAPCPMNRVDFMHLTRQGHSQLAALVAGKVNYLL